MDAHAPEYRTDDEVARAACAARGATTERSRAALMGVSVSTMRRWRDGTTPPRIDVVDMVCRNLGVSRAALFPGLVASRQRAPHHDDGIAAAADRIAAGWPELTEDQRLELSRILAGIPVASDTPAGARRAA